MVCLLILIKMLDVIRTNVASPLQIEQVGVAGVEHIKPGRFARIDHRIVNVSSV